MKFYLITGLDEGVAIEPYVINDEEHDLCYHTSYNGDSFRNAEEITKEEAYIKIALDPLLKIANETLETLNKRLLEYDNKQKTDKKVIDNAIKELKDGIFGVDVFNASQLIEVLKAFEPSALSVSYISNFIYIRRINS